jgi:uncharacterized membrane protein
MTQRDLISAPPFVCALAALVLLVASIAANGAADAFGYPSWMPPLGGLMMAVPVLVLSALTFLTMRRETASDYNVNLAKSALGGVVYVLVAALAIAYAVTVGRESSYKGEFNPTTNRFDPLFTQGTFLFASAVLAAIVTIALGVTNRQLYLASIDHQRDEVEGPDPMGALMKG